MYVDFLMTNSISYTETDIDEINEFIKAVIRLIVMWLKKVPSILQNSC